MGDPRRLKKRWSRPLHPWQLERMTSETEIVSSYGLKRKNELWKMNSILKRYFNQAKGLISSAKATTELEKDQFLKKLASLGLLKGGSQVEDALNLSLKDIMERRLQTVLVRKNLARTMIQARQFIVHEHVSIGENKITVPSYLVRVDEESSVKLSMDSPFSNGEHPERTITKTSKKKPRAPMRRDSGRPGERRGKKPIRRERK